MALHDFTNEQELGAVIKIFEQTLAQSIGYGTLGIAYLIFPSFVAIKTNFVFVTGNILFDKLFLFCVIIIFGFKGLKHIHQALIPNHTILQEKGLINIRGNKTEVVHYQEVNNLWQGSVISYLKILADVAIPVKKQYFCKIETFTQQRLKFTNEKLGRLIESQVFPYQIKRISKIYQEGIEVSFGPLVLTLDGIIIINNILVWSNIKGIKIEKGHLYIYPRNSSPNGIFFPVSSIANFSVFYTLISQKCPVIS